MKTARLLRFHSRLILYVLLFSSGFVGVYDAECEASEMKQEG